MIAKHIPSLLLVLVAFAGSAAAALPDRLVAGLGCADARPESGTAIRIDIRSDLTGSALDGTAQGTFACVSRPDGNALNCRGVWQTERGQEKLVAQAIVANDGALIARISHATSLGGGIADLRCVKSGLGAPRRFRYPGICNPRSPYCHM